jgi:hypothetical protein
MQFASLFPQLITGCESVLLELKNLSDARDASRKRVGGKRGQDAGCHCAFALSMLPLETTPGVLKANGDGQPQAAGAKRAVAVDDVTEDQTDRVLYKIEASMERLRELAEMIQATSMQGEANLIAKVTLQEGAIKALASAVQASAATATATAIAQERGRSSSAFGRLYLPIQVKKLQEWYYSYPRPLMDELTLMRTILNYRPYANPFQVGGLSIAHVRDWFKRRRHRERIRYVKLAVEAGRDPVAEEEEINLRIEQRIEHLRRSVDPNDLVKELDRVRNESSQYESMVSAFTRPSNMESYIAASNAVPTAADQHLASGGAGADGSARHKRLRTQESELDDAVVVKPGTHLEVQALQSRIRSLIVLPRSATNTNALQQVIDILRAMNVTMETRIQTGVVADLKKILKVYQKPTLLRKSTIALLESLGMSQRAILNDSVVDEAPPAPESVPPPPIKTEMSSLETPEEVEEDESNRPQKQLKQELSASIMASSKAPASSNASGSGAKTTSEPPKARKGAKAARGKKEKAKVLRPMKFSMVQVQALEDWFQQKYKPTQAEMEGYLEKLNSPPLRDEKQTVDVNMTQLRRWFNKRRCLRRPPYALMGHQEADKDGAEDETSASLAEGEDGAGSERLDVDSVVSSDDGDDDSSDDDDDDDDQ